MQRKFGNKKSIPRKFFKMIRYLLLLHADEVDPVPALEVVIRDPAPDRATEVTALLLRGRPVGIESLARLLRSRLHFDEDENLIVGIPRDYVDLTVTLMDITLTDLVTEGTEVDGRQVFAMVAKDEMPGSRLYPVAAEEGELHLY